jgi:hypothetical protein
MHFWVNEVDKMLEKAKIVTRKPGFIHGEYARFADNLRVMMPIRALANERARNIEHEPHPKQARKFSTLLTRGNWR